MHLIDVHEISYVITLIEINEYKNRFNKLHSPRKIKTGCESSGVDRDQDLTAGRSRASKRSRSRADRSDPAVGGMVRSMGFIPLEHVLKYCINHPMLRAHS